MKKTIFGNWSFTGTAILVAAIAVFYAGCGKSGVLPTSANDPITSAAGASSVAVTATAGSAWVNNSFTAQTAGFSVTFNASVSAAPTNAIIALSSGPQTAYASFANLVRFNPSGDIDAYNGSVAGYVGPSTPIPYTAGTIYSFTLTVNVAAQTYTISVTPAGGTAQTIGTGFGFRAADSTLNNYGAYVSTDGGSGTLTVGNFAVVTTPTATPTLTFTPTPTFTHTNTPTFTFTYTSTPTPTKVVQSTWRVVAGGPAHTDCQGNVWAADENYSGGTAATSTNTITGALPCSTDGALYQDQRYGGSFTYVFNVPAGNYQVTLKFAETYFTAAGDRVFDVSINGTQVLTNLDIFATAGGQNKALDEVFNNIAPSGGAITLTFGPAGVNNALVDSIQIIPQPATTPTPTFTHTNTPTHTFTLTPTPEPLSINFSLWQLQLPTGSGTSPTIISSSQLEDGFSDAYFYIGSDGWQTYMDPQTGITTSGSVHPRCEMRENGTWAASGTNTLTVTGKVDQVGGDTTTIGQMFNNTPSITLVELQYSKSLGGFECFYEEEKGEGSYPAQTTVYSALNTPYTYEMSLTNDVAQVTINGIVAFTHTISSAVSGDQFYFKCGNYDQSATAGAISTVPYTVVEVQSAQIVHN